MNVGVVFFFGNQTHCSESISIANYTCGKPAPEGLHREVVSTSCRVMSYDMVLVLVLVLLLTLVLVVVWVLVLMLALGAVVSWRLLDACSYCLQASGYLLLFPRRP